MTKGLTTPTGCNVKQRPLLRASYEVAYQCIQVKAAHSAKKNQIKSCTFQMVELVLGTEAAKKMKDIPLFNNVIADGIADMSCDILNQIV